ncbi:MAG TPA: PLP-dependent aminotransferase family protein [Usitatibacter sp.]|nr:PLP-dependent aminotransferase family protein [Usitatibacter sp.]
MIESRTFRAGERLPSTRALARARNTSAATVAGAYEKLADRGLVTIRPRSGYYVAPRAVATPASSHGPKRDSRARENEDASEIRSPIAASELAYDILARIRERQAVPLGSAFPAPSLFPLRRLAQDLARAARRMDPWRTVEDLAPGSLELRQHIAKRYALLGMSVDPGDVVITSGAMEALNLCLAAVTQPGDVVALECPAFYASLQAAERLGLKVVQVATDRAEGVDIEALENAVRTRHVKACWLMPTLQNPLGATMPVERRAKLVKMLARHQVPLVEDDVYAELRFGDPMPPAKAFDTKGLVMHCGSFSKSLAPGYRVGWCLPGRFRRDVERAKLSGSIATSVPAQEGIAEYLRQGGYDRHLRRLRRTFAANLARVRAAVERAFPAATRISDPGGGYFVWVELPPGVDTLKLHARALREGISMAPGPMFSAAGEFTGALRLNCGHPWDATLGSAIEVLGKLAVKGRDDD